MGTETEFKRIVRGVTSRLSWIWWVKCILRYIPSSEGVERTTKTQRTQRLIDHIVS